ncbi:MAG: ferritin family protein [Pseudomonadota bacterium]
MPQQTSTEDDLARAFSQESILAARHRTYALKARQEGRPGLARFFSAMARSEEIHANRLLMLLRGRLAESQANLAASLDRDLPANLAAYRAMAARAAAAGEKTAATALDQLIRVEAGHAGLAEALAQAGDPGVPAYLVCGVCGFVAEGQAPERCPVCGAVPERFSLVE